MPVDSGSSADEVAATRQAAADTGLDPSMLMGRTHLELRLEAATDDYKLQIDNAAARGCRSAR